MISDFCKTVKYLEFYVCFFYCQHWKVKINKRKEKSRVFVITYACKTTCLCLSIRKALQETIVTKKFTDYFRVVGWACQEIFYFLPYTFLYYMSLFLQSTCSVSVIRKKQNSYIFKKDVIGQKRN